MTASMYFGAVAMLKPNQLHFVTLFYPYFHILEALSVVLTGSAAVLKRQMHRLLDVGEPISQLLALLTTRQFGVGALVHEVIREIFPIVSRRRRSTCLKSKWLHRRQSCLKTVWREGF
jgi:hypothetical protein